MPSGDIMAPDRLPCRREDSERARLGAILPRFAGASGDLALLQAQSEQSGDWLLTSRDI